MEEEAKIKGTMVTGANEALEIVDHTKWGCAASATFCRTDRIDTAAPRRHAP